MTDPGTSENPGSGDFYNLWGWSNQGDVQNALYAVLAGFEGVEATTILLAELEQRWRGSVTVSRTAPATSVPDGVTVLPGVTSDDLMVTFGKVCRARLDYDTAQRQPSGARRRLVKLFEAPDSEYRVLGTQIGLRVHAEFGVGDDDRSHVTNLYVVATDRFPGRRAAFRMRIEGTVENTRDYTAIRLVFHADNDVRLPLCFCASACPDWSRAKLHQTSELLIRGDGVWTQGTGCFSAFAGRQSQVSPAPATRVPVEGPSAIGGMVGHRDDEYVEQPGVPNRVRARGPHRATPGSDVEVIVPDVQYTTDLTGSDLEVIVPDVEDESETVADDAGGRGRRGTDGDDEAERLTHRPK
jgi:hypothetical protein